MPDRAVAFTVSGWRQKYLRQSLDTWAAARGRDAWTFLFMVEPCDSFPVAAFTRWVQGVFPGAVVRSNAIRHGCMKNTRRALDFAFADGAQFAVLAEEDVVVSPDVLEYFAWARDRYAGDEGIAAVCAHARTSRNDDLAVTARVPWFSPLVWGTWRDTWTRFIRPGWAGIAGNSEAWDTSLRGQVQQAGKTCVFPALSRALHIGELSTLTTTRISEYMYELSRSDCFASDAGPQDYQELPFESLAPLVV